jgi:F420-dependent oxidoreductase-like protein
MKIGMNIDYASGLREGADAVADYEHAGLDVIWVAEAYGYDAPSQLGYIAARTERISIGSHILPIYSRTPALIAQTAAGLDALSDGRFILGIGSSGPQVVEGWHGVPYTSPLRRTEEVMEICRSVWRREVLVHEGLYQLPLPPERGTGLGKPLKILTKPKRSEIPIWVAALGPRNVEMVAANADGWLPLFFVPEWADRVWGDALARGAARRGAERPPFEIAAGGPMAITEDPVPLRDRQRSRLALYVGGMGSRERNYYNELIQRYGFEAEARQVQELYLAGKKDQAAAALPAELVEKTCLIGSASYVRERIGIFRAQGVTLLNIVPVGPDPVRLVERLADMLQ